MIIETHTTWRSTRKVREIMGRRDAQLVPGMVRPIVSARSQSIDRLTDREVEGPAVNQ
jgi:hypothetical protein